MKVNSTPQPAVSPSPTTTSTAAAGAEPAIMPDPSRRMMQDGFDPSVVLHPPVKPPVERPTLSARDRQTAKGLKGALESPFNRLRVDLGKADQPLKYDQQSGVWRGPQGQPLVSVQLKNGISAYVDPSTNKYYLAKDTASAQAIGVQPRVDAYGPLSLPRGTRFSASDFSVADVKALTSVANGWIQPRPRPIPMTVPELNQAG